MRRVAAWSGFLVATALVWLGAVVVWHAISSPAEAREAKFSSADRAVFFRLQPGESLRFDLAQDAEELRLLTHLVLPTGSAYAPERQYVYGFDVGFEPDGAPAASSSLFTRTRQSKANPLPEGGLWAQENAFAVDPQTQLTDVREFLVGVPQQARTKPGKLVVKYTGAEGALLVRVYAHYTRVRPLFIRSEALRRAEERVEHTTSVPWEKLPEGRQQELAQVQWEAIGAHGEEGRDYATLMVYRTDFRLPMLEVSQAARTYLAPGAGAAVNVQGPASVTLRVWRDSPIAAQEEASLELSALAADGSRQSWTLPRPGPNEVVSHPLQLPAGVQSVQLINRGEHDVRYTFEAPADRWFAPVEAKAAVHGVVAMLPDESRADTWAAGPACAAQTVELEPGADGPSRLIRVDARALGKFAEDEEPGRITLTMFDARGEQIGDTQLDLSGEPEPFEAAELPFDLRRGLPCAETPSDDAPLDVDATRRPAMVTRAVSGRLFLPPSVRRLEIRSTRPAAVNLYSFLPAQGDARVGAPYDAVTLADELRWEGAPVDRRSWHPLRPRNAAQLAQAGAAVSLARQVHLDPNGSDHGGAVNGEPVVLLPVGMPSSLDLFEPERDVDENAAFSLFSLLTPGKPVRARFDARTPTRPELRLHLADPGALGNEVEIAIDGRVVRHTRLHSTRVRTLLPPVAPGVREILVRSHAPGLTAAINRAPAAGEDAMAQRARTVFKLGSNTLRVPVVKHGAEAETLNIVIYTPEPKPEQAGTIHVRIDGGNPTRRSGVLVPRLTTADRDEEIGPSERLAASVSGRPSQLWYPRTIAVVLAEDLAPGKHWVEVKADTPTPLWARFFIFGEPSTPELLRQWNRRGWDGEDAP